VILASITVAGCKNPFGQPEEPWTSFESLRLGIRFSHPANWKVKEDGDSVTATAPDSKDTAFIRIKMIQPPPSDLEHEAWQQWGGAIDNLEYAAQNGIHYGVTRAQQGGCPIVSVSIVIPSGSAPSAIGDGHVVYLRWRDEAVMRCSSSAVSISSVEYAKDRGGAAKLRPLLEQAKASIVLP
jgi:hypothetical protein